MLNQIKDKMRFLIGDIRDKERLKRAMENVDIVFHLAALKHVVACEYNPFEAVKTNIIGTQNLIDVALDEEIDKFILISTDKAVNPNSVMGATKLLSERLTISSNFYKGKRKTTFSCVRFGNVLGSNIFNILLIIGIAALFIPLNAVASLDHLIILVAVTLVMFPILYTGHSISRKEGVLMLIFYGIFIWYAFFGYAYFI